MAFRTGPAGEDQRLQEALRLAFADLAPRQPGLQIGDFKVVRSEQTLLNRVFEVATGTGPDRPALFVKLADSPDDSDLAREAENMALLRPCFAGPHPRFKVVEAVGFYPQVDALVVVGFSDPCLLDVIRATCRWGAHEEPRQTTRRMAFSLGEWVRFLEDRTLGFGNPNQVRDRMIQDADEAVGRLAEMGTSSPGALLEDCRRVIRKIECSPGTLVYLAHGDLHPGNVFVSEAAENSVSVIDLRLARPRFMGCDALYFEYQLTHSFGPLRYHPGAIRGILSAFKRGYGRSLDPGSPVILGLRASQLLAALVYLSTVARTGGSLRKILCRVDTWTLTSGADAAAISRAARRA